MEKKSFNIRGYHGGLGDQLQFSCMPEYLTSIGHEVRLYTGKEVEPYRNNDIGRFIWGLNPYVKGETKEGWNLGDIPNLPYTNTTGSFISNWEAMFGLEPINTLPKIYYTPKSFELSEPEGLIELSGISMKYNKDAVIEQVRKIIKSKGINFRQIVSENQSNIIEIPELPKVTVKSLEELSDQIHNCSAIITLNSGVHSLSAAIQRFGNIPSHYSLIPDKHYEEVMDNKKFIYPNIIYLKCG